MTMSTDVGAASTVVRASILLLLSLGSQACAEPAAQAPAASSEIAAETWSVTAWGKHFEIFPEVDALVAGRVGVAHTHVTRLDGFQPMTGGRVEIVLKDGATEHVFSASEPTRPGMFAIEIEPASTGDFELYFRIHDGELSEQIRGGEVRVGTADAPGRVTVAPAPRGATDNAEPTAFLKEQQWRGGLATSWVRSGNLALSVAGLARVRPAAGGETLISAPVSGALKPAGPGSWPYVGRAVERGDALFRIVPFAAADRSLAALEADVSALTAELAGARDRHSRLQELLQLEATSRREVEQARVQVETLEARHTAAGRDLQTARSTRQGDGQDRGLSLRAPFAGEIARVDAAQGATVAAGDSLARLVRTDTLWLDVALSPSAAGRIADHGIRGVVLSDPERGATRIEQGVQWISMAPEVSPETGTVSVLLAVPSTPGLAFGQVLEAQVLSDQERPGIVIPSTALVDDGGIPVVYLQLAGESFVRQEVQVLERQGDRALVDRLQPGQRLVHRGGAAIRRASLMAGGQAHGHVH